MSPHPLWRVQNNTVVSGREIKRRSDDFVSVYVEIMCENI